jgi:NADP-dependent 3-hydroxy acid dehydrogenase YdfG
MDTERIVVITGAAGGIGAVLVERFLANGDTVMATDVSDEALERLRTQTDAAEGLITATADIASEASCAELSSSASPGRTRARSAAAASPSTRSPRA